MLLSEILEVVTASITPPLNELPFFNKHKIIQIITDLCKHNSHDVGIHLLEDFRADFASVIQFLLEIKSSELSTKKLKMAVNSIIKTKTGNEISIMELIKNNAINGDFAATYLNDKEKRSKLTSLHSQLSSPLNSFLDEARIVRELGTLRQEQPHLLSCLNQAKSVINNFDNSMKKFLDYPVSLVHSDIKIMVFGSNAGSSNAKNDLIRLRDEFAFKFADKEIVYCLSDALNYDSLRCTIVGIYLYALDEIKTFNLNINSIEEPRSKRMKELQKIISHFNADFSSAVNQLKPLAIQKKLEAVRGGRTLTDDDKPLEITAGIDEKQDEKQDEVKSSTPTKFILISKDVKQEDLPLPQDENVVLINDNELLLTETTTAYAIMEIQQLIGRITELIARTYQQVLSEGIVLSKNEFETSLKSCEKTSSELFANYNELVEKLQEDNAFSITRNRELALVSTLLKDEINPALSNLDVRDIKDYQVISAQVAALNGTIRKVQYMLERFEHFYPFYLYKASELVKENDFIKNQLQVLADQLTTYKNNFAKLKKQHWIDRSSKPLEEIESNLSTMECQLNNAEIIFDKTQRFFPISTNYIEIITLHFKEINDTVKKFESNAKKVNDALIAQEVLLNNAGLAKEKKFLAGTNATLFHLPAPRSQPSANPQEQKTMAP